VHDNPFAAARRWDACDLNVLNHDAHVPLLPASVCQSRRSNHGDDVDAYNPNPNSDHYYYAATTTGVHRQRKIGFVQCDPNHNKVDMRSNDGRGGILKAHKIVL
jgi:hypothetical protein